MVGEEVFRAPGWSAGFLHLHFSVARKMKGSLVGREDSGMIKEDESEPHIEGRPVHRVSSAAWPLNVRRVVATGRAAQRRRDWIMQRRWLVTLADVLPMRLLLVLATLLVVVSSLFVAALGLHFWYLLLLPLLLFAFLLTLPAFLASKVSTEATTANLPTFAQEVRSSTGLLSLYAQEWRSSPGFLQELRSNPGFLQELKSNSGFLQELKSNPGFLQELKSSSGFLQELRSGQGVLSAGSPATPMPVVAEAPLVRVLETYDLRQEQVRRYLGETTDEETSKHTRVPLTGREPWLSMLATERLETDSLSGSDGDVESAETRRLSTDEAARSQTDE